MTQLGQSSSVLFLKKSPDTDDQNLNEVLTEGNDTGGLNIVVSEGDAIQFANSGFLSTLVQSALAGNITLTLPATTGTIALLSDIPGTEDLQTTLAEGNSTGNNFINFNRASAKIMQIGTGDVEAYTGPGNGFYFDTSGLGDFSEQWFYMDNLQVAMGNKNNMYIDLSNDGAKNALCLGTNWRVGSAKQEIVIAQANFLTQNRNFGVVAIASRNTQLNGNSYNNSVAIGGSGLTIGASNRVYLARTELTNITRYASTPALSNDLDVTTKKYVDDADTFTEAVEATVANTINATWETVTLPGAPANSLVQVQITCVANNNVAGVRPVGSSLSRLCDVDSNSCNFPLVNTNGSSQIEIYSSDISDVTFRNFGSFGA